MKMTSPSPTLGVEENGVQAPPAPLGAALFGLRRAADRPIAQRTIELTLESDSLCRIAGHVRGARIYCRQGRVLVPLAALCVFLGLQHPPDFLGFCSCALSAR